MGLRRKKPGGDKPAGAEAGRPRLNTAFAQGLSPRDIQSLEERLYYLQKMGIKPRAGVRLNVAGDVPQAAALGWQRGAQPAGRFVAPVRQLELPLTPDKSRPLYIHPIPIEEAVALAAKRGLPYGASIAEGNWHDVRPVPQLEALMEHDAREATLGKLRQLLLDKGVEGANVVPLAAGAESSVFATPDGRVVKLGRPEDRWTYAGDYSAPENVWGVLPLTSSRITAGSADDPSTWDVGLQQRVQLGKATGADMKTLRKALMDQGWLWHDDHRGNIGMMPGAEYRPVVIDGRVEPWDGMKTTRYPFVPPKGPIADGTTYWRRQLEAAPAVMALNAPQPPAEGASAEWGFDGSMAISPREWRNWENVASQGYGGPEHQAYVSAINEALDVPSIPERYVQSLGIRQESLPTYFPDYKGGDMTLRQYLAAVPELMQRQQMMEVLSSPDDAEKAARLRKWEEYATQTDKGKVVNDAAASLAGVRHFRDNPQVQQVVNAALSAVKSGTPGGEFEDAPEWSESEFKQLQAQHGEEANRMLPPGGKSNHRRLAVYELASALQDGEHAPKGATTTQAIGNLLFANSMFPTAARRANDLLVQPAPKGRINMALDSWNAVRGDVLGDSSKPMAVSGDKFAEYSPNTWDGLGNQMTNASWAAGRNVYQPWNAVAGDMGTAVSLIPEAVSKDGLAGVTKPFRFQQDTADSLNRVAPVRPDNQTPQEFAKSRGWAQDWNSAKGGWLSSRLGPAMMEVQGRKRQYLPPALDVALGAPQEILSNPYELGATVALSLPAGRRMGRAAGAQVIDEARENVTQGPALQGLLSGDIRSSIEGAVRSPSVNSYMFQREDGSDVRASDDDYWQQLNRSKEEWGRRAQERYRQWDR